MVLTIFLGGIIFNINSEQDHDRAKYEVASVIVLLLGSSIGLFLWMLCWAYDNFDDMRIRMAYGDNLNVIDIPAEDFPKIGIDLVKEKPIYMKTHYECSRAHDHANEHCVKDRKCYKVYLEKNVANTYDELTKNVED